MIMIAAATLFTTVYAGFVGSPWWTIILCAATLLISLAASSIRLQPTLKSPKSFFDLGLFSLPHCLLCAAAAFFSGQALHRLWS
jgi:hypothetical protein